VATTVELIVRYQDYPYLDTQRLIVGWGDGKTDTTAGPAVAGSIVDTLKHTYAVSGSFLPAITVLDDDGGQDSKQAPNSIVIFDPTARGTIAGYETLDLGTLGGLTAIPNDINDLGQIVGSTPVVDAPIGDDFGQHGFDHAFLWQNGSMRDLGVLPGDRGSSAQRINAGGVIAGSSWWANYASSGGAVWANGGAMRLAPPPMYDDRIDAHAVAINSAGDVLWNRFGENRASSVLQRHGDVSGEEVREGYSVSGGALNDRDQIVGVYSYHPEGFPGDVMFFRGFIWDNGVIRELQPLGQPTCSSGAGQCPQANALDINDSGQSVGFSVGSDGREHFVSWTADGTVSDLGVAAPEIIGGQAVFDTRTSRIAINDRGQIAGSDGNGAFFWENGTARTLGSLGGGHTHVVDLNQDGTVVGMSSTSNGEQHIFIWSKDRGMVDLGTGPQGMSGAWATGINNRGDVIGISGPCLRYPSPADECSPPRRSRATLWRVGP
jgi:probable HAF family extracellular repeat protein